MKLPILQELLLHHHYFNFFIMLVNCKILSRDFLINQKIENFIRKTPFFHLEYDNNNESDQIIFWDIDTINIDIFLIKERIIKGCIIFLISSIMTKKSIDKMFEKECFNNIAILRRNIIYSQFVEEVSILIDKRIQHS